MEIAREWETRRAWGIVLNNRRVLGMNAAEGVRMRVDTVVHRKPDEWMVVEDKKNAGAVWIHSMPESVGEVVIDLLTVY